ncbi:rhamnogalacturonan acetylesterase [Leeuwenhoekiella sp. W20_SRS_FM14]|uniref:rhamnogalacturonan acetylesterase n=1 Tax=Leeuwenhoekiella sp. W20_SRS_FM14 TaxID=3240270 RepID=UPI003F9510E9
MKIVKLTCLLIAMIFFVNCDKVNAQKPTVYCVGDSTVKNGQGNGDGGLWGWGDFIGQYLDTTQVRVENHALGGTSSRTFQSKGLWQPVLDSLQAGDYVLIQFGHNDNGALNDDSRARGTIKGIGEETEEIDNMLTGEHEVVHSYGWYIRKVVTEAKSKGAIPVIMAPIPRNDWENGKVPRNADSYGGWAQQIAEEEGVTFINLNDKMASEMEARGEEQVTGHLFYKRDHTHTSAKGAVLAASLIAEGLAESDNSLKNYLLENPKITLPRKRNLFLIGDSTVADNGQLTKTGWGVYLQQHVDTTRMVVHNKARGGRSSRTFRYEGLWDAVKEQLQPGDFVLMQFGHNDGGNIDKAKYRGSIKGMGDETQEVQRDSSGIETVHSYGWYMKQYIKETKVAGATPIVLSMIPRNDWSNGKVDRAVTSYGGWAKEAAAQAGGYFLDLNEAVAQKYEEVGKDSVNAFFPDDHTHTNIAGAQLNARIVAQLIEGLRQSDLRDYIYIQEEK